MSNWLKGVKRIESPNQGGTIKPTLLVLHYTASGAARDADEKFFQRPSAKASAHIVVERDGEITQCVPFNKKAWHAGVSTWRGRPNCNSYSIGIEIDNWGLLTKTEDGRYRSHTGEVIDPENVISAKNKLGNHGYWETYPEKQLKAVEQVIDTILEMYPITEIVGHEDVSPRRKIDPGPALYRFITKMNNKVSGGRGAENSIEKKTVIASPFLNVRSGPGTSYKVVDTVDLGKWVEVLYQTGGWAKIAWPPGYVHTAYLQ